MPAPAVRSTGDDDRHIFAKGAMINFVGKMTGNGLQYTYSVIIARILGADGFGLYMLGFTIISFADVISRLGLDSAAVKYIAQHHGAADYPRVKGTIIGALGYSLLASIVTASAIYLFADDIGNEIFNKPRLAALIQPLSWTIPFMVGMAISLAVIQGFKIMKYAVYTQNLFLPTGNIVLVLILSALGLGLNGVVYSWMFTSLAAAGMALIFLLRTFRGAYPLQHGELNPVSTIAKAPEGLLRFSSSLLLITILTTLIIWSDIIMLGYFRPAHDVGIYNAASKTAMLASIILVSFNAIFSPMISDLYHRGELQRLRSMFKFVSRWIYTITLPFFLILVLFSKEIMLIFGSDFVSGWNVLIIIATTYFINASTGPAGIMLIMSGQQRVMMYNSIGVFVFNIAADILLIPDYGTTGAAIASCASIVGYCVLMLVEVFVIMKMHPYDTKFVKPLIFGILVTALCVGLMHFMPLEGLVAFLVYAPLLLLIFILLIVTKGVTDEDRALVNRIKMKLSGNSAVTPGL